jgi:hypothetical protein
LHGGPGESEIADHICRASDVTAFEADNEAGKNRRNDAESKKIKRDGDENEKKCGAAGLRGRGGGSGVGHRNAAR